MLTINLISTENRGCKDVDPSWETIDRKSTRLNSSHSQISYAVFCLKKKKKQKSSNKCRHRKDQNHIVTYTTHHIPMNATSSSMSSYYELLSESRSVSGPWSATLEL